MDRQRLQVAYPAAEAGAPPVIVERTELEDITPEFVRSYMVLGRAAYTPQLADMLPREAIESNYDPGDESCVAQYQDRAAFNIIENRAEYWVVRDPDEPQRLVGMAAIMDAKDYGLFVGSVMVVPPWRNGIGSRVMHAIAAHSKFGPGNRVSLDGFVGSSVNDWYQRLGFEPGDLNGSLDMGGHRMPLRTYTAIALGGVAARLEQRVPALTQGKVLVSPMQRGDAALPSSRTSSAPTDPIARLIRHITDAF